MNQKRRNYDIKRLRDICEVYCTLRSTRKILVGGNFEPTQLLGLTHISIDSLASICAKLRCRVITNEEVDLMFIDQIDVKQMILKDDGRRIIKSIFYQGCEGLEDEMVKALADLEAYENWDEDVEIFLGECKKFKKIFLDKCNTFNKK